MSDKLSETGSDHDPLEIALGGSSNGVHHDDAAAVAIAIAAETDTADGEADAAADAADAAVANAGAASVADVVATDVSTEDAAPVKADPAAAPADEVASDVAASLEDQPDDGSGFLANLVKAMQTTAAGERARLGEDADRRRDAHIAAVEARRAAEVGRMRELAADDLKGIDAWAEDERQRIQAEHDRRAAALQADLENSLAQHAGRIEREVAAVQGAVITYRSDLDGFFASLDRESDPVEIARQASQRPAFPALEAIGSEASAEPGDAATTGRSRANPEATATSDLTCGSGIGVMADPATFAHGVADLSANLTPTRDTAPAESSVVEASESSGAAADEAEAADEAQESSGAPVDEAEAEPVSQARLSSGSPTAILQSVPISRPMGWLRRDRDQDHEEH